MSLKLFKSQENSLINPDLANPPSADDLPQTQQRKWKNTWRFRLDTKIPLDKVVSSWGKEAQIRKKIVQKYYGKKIQYIVEPREIKTIASRSKLFKWMRIDDIPTAKNNLKSKGNLVILAKGYYWKSYKRGVLKENDRILSKKIFKYCEKAEIKILEEQDLLLPKYLYALKHLSINMNPRFSLVSLGGILCYFLNLETFKVKPLEYSVSSSRVKQPKTGLFGALHKLSRLKKVKLITDEEAIQGFSLEEDLEEFYNHPSHNFDFSITIQVCKQFGKRLRPGLVKILNTAEYLCLSDCRDERAVRDGDYMKMTKEERRRMRNGKKNCVKIFSDSCEIDVLKVLSYCDSLENLYLREADDKISWEISSVQKEIKALKNLRNVTLEVSRFIIENYSEASEEENSPFSSPLGTILSQLKEKCLSLQNLSLYLSTSEFINFEWVREECPNEVPFFLESLDRLVQEISTFDKLKTFGLLMVPDDFQRFLLSKILANKSLESFQVKFHSQTKGSHPDWGNSFFAIENKSEIKKLAVTIPEGRRRIPLYRANLLNYIRMLDNLEMVELVDNNLEVVAFDFLYGLVMSLLDKKNMRKILICTKVLNTFYSGNNGEFFSKSLENQLKNMLNEVSQDLESRVKKLKEGQLEEILVGKLQNYGFDYLCYNREMKVTEKFFWTEKEMRELLGEKKDLARRYKEIFELFNKKDKDDDDDEESDK